MSKNLLHRLKNNVNRFARRFGLELVTFESGFQEGLYPYSSRPVTPRYVNIGAGDFFHPFWHNLDMPNAYYENSLRGKEYIIHDLTSDQPLPFESHSLHVVYCSHVIEHLSDMNVKSLFSEIFRCLGQGGYFRATCPDTDLYFRAYRENDYSFWKYPNAYGRDDNTIEQKFLGHFATRLTSAHPDRSSLKVLDDEIRSVFQSLPVEEALDYFISKLPTETVQRYHADHVNWFNLSKLTRMLRYAGFTDVYESRFLQSRCAQLRDPKLFDRTCPELSLYIECRK